MHYQVWVFGEEVDSQLEKFECGSQYSYELTSLVTLSKRTGVVELRRLIEDVISDGEKVLIASEDDIFEPGSTVLQKDLLYCFPLGVGNIGGIVTTDKKGNLKQLTRVYENGKFDYCSIGGRWENLLIIKEGIEPPSDDGAVIQNHYNSLPIKCIDFDKMKRISLSKHDLNAHVEIGKYLDEIKYKTLTDFYNENKERLDKLEWSVVRKEYGQLSFIKKLANIPHPDVFNSLKYTEVGLELWASKTKEEITFLLEHIGWMPLVLLNKGEWIEKENISIHLPFYDKDKTRLTTWIKQTVEYIKSQDPETMITVVDCHW